jgi:hypothetical protein
MLSDEPVTTAIVRGATNRGAKDAALVGESQLGDKKLAAQPFMF